MIKVVEEDIEKNHKVVNETREAFGMDKFDESPYFKGSIALLKALNKDYMELESRREKIIEVQTELYEKIIEVSRRIDEKFDEISTIDDMILSQAKIQEMEETLEKYENIYNERIGQIEQYQVLFCFYGLFVHNFKIIYSDL